jgi:hypothetical protein
MKRLQSLSNRHANGLIASLLNRLREENRVRSPGGVKYFYGGAPRALSFQHAYSVGYKSVRRVSSPNHRFYSAICEAVGSVVPGLGTSQNSDVFDFRPSGITLMGCQNFRQLHESPLRELFGMLRQNRTRSGENG